MSRDRKRGDVRRMGSFLSGLRDQRRKTSPTPSDPPREETLQLTRLPESSVEARADLPPEAEPPLTAPSRDVDRQPQGERLIDASVRHVALPGAEAERGSGVQASAEDGAALSNRAPAAGRDDPADEAGLRETLQDLWNGAATLYVDSVGRAATQFGPRILELTGTRPGESVLDIACGPGALAGAADAFGISATGIDFAPAMIATARSRFPRVEFRIGDAEALDVRPDSFEAVVSTFGLTQFADPARGLTEARRALKPGGRLVLAHWAGPSDSPLLAAAHTALNAHGLSVAARKADFSLPDAANEAMSQAGFSFVAVERADATLALTEADLLEAAGMLDPSIALMARTLSEKDRTALCVSMAATLAEHRADAAFSVPVQAIFYIAERPAAVQAAVTEERHEEAADTLAIADIPSDIPTPTPAPAPELAKPADDPHLRRTDPSLGGAEPQEAGAHPVDRLWRSAAARRSGLGERPGSAANAAKPLETAEPEAEDPAAGSRPAQSPSNALRKSFGDAASWKARSRARFLNRAERTAADAATPRSDEQSTHQVEREREPVPRRKPTFGLVRRILDRSDGRE